MKRVGSKGSIVSLVMMLLACWSRADALSGETGETPRGSDTKAASRLTREGLVVDFAMTPANARPSDRLELKEGDYADIAFRITDASTGQPVRSLVPGAWMDIGQPVAARGNAPLDCRQKMSLYLSGRVGIRPMIDLNSYYVLALNQDSSISVIDPHVGMAGRTYLYAHIPLPRPGADWAKSADGKRLFVTTPRGGRVAVVDTERFKVAGGVDVGGMPVRIVLQGDERYLWVGNDTREARESGVVVVDPEKLAVVARIPTGRGHHEIVLSPDDRWAFVSNRDEGTVSVIDIHKLEKIKDVKTGVQPISMAYSRLSQALYVADGQTGKITVVDGRSHGTVTRIDAKPGLGPMRLTEDGRWGFVVNSQHDSVHIIDISGNRLAHTVPVGKRPHQIAVTRTFAYVRSLDSGQVGMIPLSQLGRDQPPAVTEFAAGTESPGSVGPGMAVAAPMAPGLEEAAMMVANPADGNVYYYMEGMVAPMATFRNYGHRPVALEVVNRSLKETQPGVYQTTVRLPAAGKYDVGFLLQTPSVVHCFTAEAKTNPLLKRVGPAIEIEHLIKNRRVAAGEPVTLVFKLIEAETRKPRAGLSDVRVVYYLAPGRPKKEATVREVGEGIYEAALSLAEAGAYYVHVAVPSAKIGIGDLTFLSLIAQAKTQAGRRVVK